MVCHGLDGQNTGVPFATTVSPPVPSLASAEVQAYTDGQLKWIIENGIYPSGMPPSKGDFSTGRSGTWSSTSAICPRPAASASRRSTAAPPSNLNKRSDRRHKKRSPIEAPRLDILVRRN